MFPLSVERELRGNKSLKSAISFYGGVFAWIYGPGQAEEEEAAGNATELDPGLGEKSRIESRRQQRLLQCWPVAFQFFLFFFFQLSRRPRFQCTLPESGRGWLVARYLALMLEVYYRKNKRRKQEDY